MRLTLISFLLLFITNSTYNILGQSGLEAKPQSGDLSLRIKSISFIENNEFFILLLKDIHFSDSSSSLNWYTPLQPKYLSGQELIF